jgi:hypothetical protein
VVACAQVFRRAAASVVTLGSGASLGPEAPSVELGANTAAVLAPKHLSKRRQRMLVAAGAAAGAPVSQCRVVLGPSLGRDTTAAVGGRSAQHCTCLPSQQQWAKPADMPMRFQHTPQHTATLVLLQ